MVGLPADWHSRPVTWKLKTRDLLARTRLKRIYRADPLAFVADCMELKLNNYQREVLACFEDPNAKVAVRAPWGAGKTTIAAALVHWFALTRDGEDWKLPTTAGWWPQLERYLWPEIHHLARGIAWSQIGRPSYETDRELQLLALKLATGESYGLSPNNPMAMEGGHADCLAYVYDEAKAIPDGMFDASEGAFVAAGAGGLEACALVISTPGAPVGRFYEIASHKPGFEGWENFHITSDQAIAAGRMSAEWRAAKARMWLETSALFQQRVEANFAADEERAVISLALVERAQQRWRELAVQSMDRGWGIPQARLEGKTVLGVDVADTGKDASVIAARHGDCVAWIRRYEGLTDIMELTGMVAGLLRAGYEQAVVDAIGIGAGVYARLKEQGHNIVPFVASQSSDAWDMTGEMQFANLRAEAMWRLRELLMSEREILLPPSDRLTADLTVPEYKVLSSGRYLIESKEDLARPNRLGRSPDEGDAVVMSFWEQRKPHAVSWRHPRRITPPL